MLSETVLDRVHEVSVKDSGLMLIETLLPELCSLHAFEANERPVNSKEKALLGSRELLKVLASSSGSPGQHLEA